MAGKSKRTEQHLSKQEAAWVVAQQQLCLPTKKLTPPKKVEHILSHCGYVQIDTISVVERAHHHVLWSRCNGYTTNMIEDAVRNKTAFEYWSHAAAYLPIKDFRFSLLRKQHFKENSWQWYNNNKVKEYVLDRIRDEGALQSKDFERTTKAQGWWDWKPAKRALEHLYHDGTLMVARRDSFQKVYDVTERVLPPTINTNMPTPREYAEHLLQQSLQAYGIIQAEEAAYLRSAETKKLVREIAQEYIEQGKALQLMVEGVAKPYLMATTCSIPTQQTLASAEQVHILSPFDNLVIQRKRLQHLFEFEYQIECYIPAPKRVHGYFSLPILIGNSFIGRMDCKAHRKLNKLEVLSLSIERPLTDTQLHLLANSIHEFSMWNRCTHTVVTRTAPAKHKKQLASLLQSREKHL